MCSLNLVVLLVVLADFVSVVGVLLLRLFWDVNSVGFCGSLLSVFLFILVGCLVCLLQVFGLFGGWFISCLECGFILFDLLFSGMGLCWA